MQVAAANLCACPLIGVHNVRDAVDDALVETIGGVRAQKALVDCWPVVAEP